MSLKQTTAAEESSESREWRINSCNPTSAKVIIFFGVIGVDLLTFTNMMI